MGMLDEEVGAKPSTDYNFMGTGLNDLIGELNTPRQSQNIDESAGLDDIAPETEEQERSEPERLQVNKSVARETAGILTMAIDGGLSTILGAVIAGDDPDNFKCSEEDRETLEEALTKYVQLKGSDIPPGLALVIVVLAIYAPKTVAAFQFRKEKARADKAEAELEEARKRLKKYEPEPEP